MKKVIFFLIICIGIISTQAFSSEQQIPNKEDADFYKKVMQIDPAILTPQQFYKLEESMISLFSGSGGCFIGKEERDWIRKCVASFNARNIKIKDPLGRDNLVAWSYFNNGDYKTALKEFKKINNQWGIEIAEWFIYNDRGKLGDIKVKEHPGQIPCIATEITRTETDRYIFISYFKGPIYRYDKNKKSHALIYHPSAYDWCDGLEFRNEKLFIKLRDLGAAKDNIFVFDNKNNKIDKLI